jgi:hypothetical protein
MTSGVQSLGAADKSVCATSGLTEQVWLNSISPVAKFVGVTSGVLTLEILRISEFATAPARPKKR